MLMMIQIYDRKGWFNLLKYINFERWMKLRFIKYEGCGYLIPVFNNANWFRSNLELIGVSQLSFKGR